MNLQFLHNHLGYARTSKKIALVRSGANFSGASFSVVDVDSAERVYVGDLKCQGPVAQWRDWVFWKADFSALKKEGHYVLLIEGASLPVMSSPFPIVPQVYDGQIISDLVHYLKSQRCTGVFDEADRSCPKLGTHGERVDVHGGWFDASGDASKYLSHLSYANFMNPQQTPQVVWNLVDARARLPQQSMWLDERLIDEALHGADFLVRMQDNEGYFYMTVFDRWSKDVEQREICSYTTQKGLKFDTYQAAYRQGGGGAIAALARASTLPRSGEYGRGTYLHSAELGFAHLEQHNISYLDDQQENIIDDYCALLAACELAHATTGKPEYEAAAMRRARSLLQRQNASGWFWADNACTRSYFHAAEAGLPYIALMRFVEVFPLNDLQSTVRDCLRKAWKHELDITERGDANPFLYPRQYIKYEDKMGRKQFFIPHDNESGYWWQGENARLASLASAATMAQGILVGETDLSNRLGCYAQACLDWIFGRNPFDACMMQGHGHNNPRYEAGYWNAPGGVCNGITSGLENEEDIDFRMPDATMPGHSWRWSEQWIPHGAWLLHALSQQVKTTD